MISRSSWRLAAALLLSACTAEKVTHRDSTDLVPELAGTYPVGAGALINLAARNVVGDGRLDIITVAESDQTVRILSGNADGSFAAAIAVPTELDARQAVTGDVNGDGIPDLLAIGHDNAFNVRLGAGNGTFGAATRYALRNHGSRLVVADLNHDGFADVVAAHDGSGQPIYVTAYLGSASGALQQVWELGTTFFTTMGMASGDFDGDGQIDVAVASSDPGAAVIVFHGLGSGQFAAATTLPPVSLHGGTDGTASIAVADLNGDGRDDIITVGYALSNQVVVRLATATGFSAPRVIALPSPIAVAVGDVDADGRLDVVAANLDDGSLSLLRGKGDGTFADPVRLAIGGSPSYLAMGDFDGDGMADVAAISVSDASVRVFLTRRSP